MARPKADSYNKGHENDTSAHRQQRISMTRKCHSPSSSKRHYSHPSRDKIVTYSPSPYPEQYKGVKIKEEPLEPPEYLHKSYPCSTCNMTMYSLLSYNIHLNGRRHRKNMKVKNVPAAVAASIPATVISENQSKYPKAPPGVIHRQVQKPAKIQEILEKNIKQPCPGHESDTSAHRQGRFSMNCMRHSPSSSKSHYSHPSRDKIVTYSPSPYPEQYKGVKIKEEPLEPPEYLHKSYPCSTCNMTMYSLLSYNTHLNGQRHRKNMKVKNVPAAVATSIPATVISENQSKYPKAPPGVIRRKVQKPAKIQEILEKNIKQPCPGLNFVTEIQGISGVQYYCSLCDSVCSSHSVTSHLTGFKHQLKSVPCASGYIKKAEILIGLMPTKLDEIMHLMNELTSCSGVLLMPTKLDEITHLMNELTSSSGDSKQLKPDTYELMMNKPKYKIEDTLRCILYAVQKQEGMGRMAVEVEEQESVDKPYDPTQPPRDYRNIPSTSRRISREQSDMLFAENYTRSAVPDQSASGYFCRICQYHMNSAQMWDAHIRGKHHINNVKKMTDGSLQMYR